MKKINYFNEHLRPGIHEPVIRVKTAGTRKAYRIYDFPENLTPEEKKETLLQIARDVGIEQKELTEVSEALNNPQDFSGLGTAPIIIFTHIILSLLSDEQALNIVRGVIGMKKYTVKNVFDGLQEPPETLGD